MKEYFSTPRFRRVLVAVGCVLLALLVFKAGIIVGYRKADFSYRWGEQYHRNFAGPKRGFFRDVHDREFIESHGVFGQVLKVALPKVSVRGVDDVERIVIIGDRTVIRRFDRAVAAAELRADDHIVVIGAPNAEGQIDAKFIRLLPPPDGRRFTAPAPPPPFPR